jgi:hypothetical protein
MSVPRQFCAMKRCLLTFLLIVATSSNREWAMVAGIGIKAHIRTNRHSALFGSYPDNLENGRGDSTENDASNQQRTKTRGYKFGDVTRAAVGAFQSKVNSLTGNDTYKFGDLAKWLDAQAKDSALQLDASAKKAIMDRVRAYTKRPDYKIGDITKEIVRRFEVGEYKKEDLWLFLRICLLIGGSASAGAATALPVKVLLELLEVSMASSVSEDLTSMLTNEVNNRMKEFFTGDRSYQFGDLTKKLLLGQRNREVDLTQEVLGKVTCNEVVEFSDLSKNLVLLMAERKRHDGGEEVKDMVTTRDSEKEENATYSAPNLETAALKEFEEWEKKYLASINALGPSISDNDCASWDESLVRANERS